MTAIQASLTLEAKPSGTITDYKYSPTGQYLAIADSQGYVHVYSKKDGKSYSKINQFKADEGSIWSISWADAKYGNVIGIGSFRNKVAIFQQIANVWKQIAYHDLHHASVNWVQFAQHGLKLYAGSSDGLISILQYGKAWKSHAFTVSDAAVATFALQQLPLGQIIAEQNADKIYPRIATVTKDQKIKIWAHESEKMYGDHLHIFEQQPKAINKSGYLLVREFATPKQTIRTILWRPTWGTIQSTVNRVSLITCSQEGSIKQLKLGIPSSEKGVQLISTDSKQTKLNLVPSDKIQILLQGDNQVTKISQSLTGNIISASLVNKTQQESVIFEEIDQDQWAIIQRGKL